MANKDSAEDKARYDKLKDELAKMLMKKRAADRQLVRLVFDPAHALNSTRPKSNCPSTTSRQTILRTLRLPGTSYTALTATSNQHRVQQHDGNTK